MHIHSRSAHHLVERGLGCAYIDWQVYFYVFFFGGFKYLFGKFDVFAERAANVSAERFDKSKAHAAANDEIVHLVEQFFDNRNFGGDFRAAQDSGKRTVGRVHDLFDGVDFAVHDIAKHFVVREIACYQRC